MLTLPTEELVRTACAAFDKENWAVEEALTELFRQYPRNNDARHVLLKVVAVNSLYSTQIPVYAKTIPNVMDVAQHICGNAEVIDTALAAGSPEIVDTIANVSVVGKKHRLYFSFASKFCSWHRPDSYPIWDANVERYIGRWQKQTDVAKDFNLRGHWQYPAFHSAMTALRERYGLRLFSFKDIDKFLVLQGEKES